MSIFSKAWKAITKPVKKVVSKVTDILGEDLTKAITIATAAYGGYTLATSSGLVGGTAAAGTTTAGATAGTTATGAAATSATTAAGTTTIAAGSTLTASQAASLGIDLGTSATAAGATSAGLSSTLFEYAKTAGTALTIASTISASAEQEEQAKALAIATAKAEEEEKTKKTSTLWSLRKQLTSKVGTKTSGSSVKSLQEITLG